MWSMKNKVIFSLIMILITPPFLYAEIYKCVDKNGEVRFTTEPRDGCVVLTGSIQESALQKVRNKMTT